MDSYSVQAVLSVKDKNFTSSMNSAVSSLSGLETSTSKASTGVAGLGTAFAVANKVVSACCSAIKNSVSAAVERVDTLNQYPKIMEQMGFSADAAEESINRLSEGIQGLPTSLDSIVDSAQSIALITGDLDEATDVALALNNALIASGASTDEAARATEQYDKMLSTGKVNSQQWTTLEQNMKYALVEVAEELGITSGSTQELYSAMQEGTITFDQFNAALVTCSEAEGGFAEMALTSSEGIATSWENVKTAVVRGVANMITAWNEAAESKGIPTIQESLNGLRKVVDTVFGAASKVITAFVKNLDSIAAACVPVVAGITSLKIVQSVSKQFDKFKASAKDAAAALDNVKSKAEKAEAAQKALESAEKAAANAEEKQAEAAKKAASAAQTATKAAQKQEEAVKKQVEAEKLAVEYGKDSAEASEAKAEADQLAAEAKELYATAARESAEADQASLAATEAATQATQAQVAAEQEQAAAIEGTNLKTITKNALLAAMSGELTIAEAAQKAFNAAMEANPIGVYITAITALVSVLGVVCNVLRKFAKAEDESVTKAKELAEESEELIQTCQDDIDAFHSSTAEIKKNASALSANTSRVVELAKKENKTAEEVAELQALIVVLNDSIDDLNLSYDAENDLLSENIDWLEKKGKAEAASQAYNSYVEEYNGLLADQYQTELEISAIEEEIAANEAALAAEKERLIEACEDYSIVEDDLETALSEEYKALEPLREQYQANADALDESKDLVIASYNAMTEAEEAALAEQSRALQEAVENDTVSYEMLSEANQATADSMRDAWNDSVNDINVLFSALSDECELTAQDMIDNIEESQRVQEEWGDNMELLRDRFAGLGLDDSILDQLADLGVDGAGYVKALAEATGDELITMAEDWEKYGGSAETSLFQSWGTAKDEIPSAVYDYITSPTEEALSEQLSNIDWADMGTDVVAGLAEGMEDTELIAESSEVIAEDTESELRDAMGANSPAALTEPIGEDVVAGLALGMQDTASVTEAATVVADAIKSALNSALEKADFSSAADSMCNSIANATKSGMKKVSSAVSSGMKDASKALQSELKDMTSTTKSGMSDMASEVTAQMGTIKSAVQSSFKDISSVVSSAVNELKSTVATGFSSMTTSVNAEMNQIPAIISAAMDSCTTSVTNGVNKMNTALNTGKLKSTAKSVASGITSEFSGLYSSLYSSGQNAMSGLQAGLNSRKSSVMSTAQSIANSVTTTINKALKVGSPSRVLKETGKNAGSGLVIGLKSMLSDVQDISEKLADSVTDMAFGAFESPRLSFESSGSYVFDTEDILEEIKSLKNALIDDTRKPILVESSIDVDGREIARSTATYMQDEQDKLQARNSRRLEFSIGG